MPKDAFQYIFRFCCDPGFNDERELPLLKRYVEAARIDEVAVFANVQEINTGHMDFAEQTHYLDLLRSVQALLAPIGVRVSVNHWHSLMHADLGKKLRPDQHFRRMVDVAGNEAELCVCPLCPEWQTYIAEIYARYAELGIHMLWVEDDFRLHNHSPLVWGGCFCAEHMARYSERAGHPLERATFVEGLLRSGTPHPYRRIWLEVSRESLLEAAARIASAVRAVDQGCRIGLMSSDPQIHAAEGRDWGALLHVLAAGQPPVSRIHLPGYQESSGAAYLHGFNRVSMLTRAFLPKETEVYPELENFPYSLFSKSRKFTRFQLLSALPLNLSGMTIDLYDLNGNGIVWREGYQEMLRDSKDFLNRMSALGVFASEARGVRVLVNARSSYSLHSAKGLSMEELYPQESFFAALLPALGVPYVYTESVALAGEIVAIAGQVLRNYSAKEIIDLFSQNFVILTGDALETLLELGLGGLAAARSARWLEQNSGAYTYEQLDDSLREGLANARASALLLCGDVLDVAYQADVERFESSAFYDACRRRCCAGEVVTRGRVLIYPFGRFPQDMPVPPMLLNGVRQELLYELLCTSASPNFPMVKSQAYLEPYYYQDGSNVYLYLVNGSSDAVEGLTLYLPDALRSAWAKQPSRELWAYLSENNQNVLLRAELKGDELHIRDLVIAALECALLWLCPREEVEENE